MWKTIAIVYQSLARSKKKWSTDEPKIQFEQYPTTPHLAARMLYTADTVYDDIEDKAIGDFGSGCGILSIAANVLGAG